MTLEETLKDLEKVPKLSPDSEKILKKLKYIKPDEEVFNNTNNLIRAKQYKLKYNWEIKF